MPGNDKFGERQLSLRGELTNPSSVLSVESLMDAILAVFSESEKLDRAKLPHLDAFVKRCAFARRFQGVAC